MLSYGLERKEAFQDDKNVFRKGQNWVFSNEVKPWFPAKKKQDFFLV